LEELLFQHSKKKILQEKKIKFSPGGRKQDQEDPGLQIQVSGDIRIPLNLKKIKKR